MSALIIDVPAAITRVACGRILSAVRARIRQGRGMCVEIHKRGGVGPSGQSAFN